MIIDVLQKLPTGANHIISSVDELLFLQCHYILMLSGLTCVYEQPSSVPGFAPSIKDLPPNRFIHDGWNQDPTVMTTSYKLKSQPKKLYALNLLHMTSTADIITIIEKTSNDSHTIDLDPSEYIDTVLFQQLCGMNSTPNQLTLNSQILTQYPNFSNLFMNSEDLTTKIKHLVSKLIPTTTTTSTTTANTPSSSSSSAPDVTRPYGYMPPPSTYMPPSSVLVPPTRTPVGNGDLNPFPDLVPSIVTPQGGTGSLVGPDHPIFQPIPPDYNTDPFAGPRIPGNIPYIPGLPQPRFDPFYPEIPGEIPTGPFGPGPVGLGRGQDRRRVPGEPDPDHLSPPQFGDQPNNTSRRGGGGLDPFGGSGSRNQFI